jgi:hypothetical protein
MEGLFLHPPRVSWIRVTLFQEAIDQTLSQDLPAHQGVTRCSWPPCSGEHGGGRSALADPAAETAGFTYAVPTDRWLMPAGRTWEPMGVVSTRPPSG